MINKTFTSAATAAIIAALSLIGGAGSSAQQAARSSAQQAAPSSTPLLRTAFSDGTGGGRWTAIGKNGKTTQTTENAKQALRWDYSLQKGDLSALMLPVTPEGALSKAKSLRFLVKCSAQTPLILVLQEKKGGRYLAMFSAPADVWQTVELAPDDFLLVEGKNDPKDPNNHLDMEQVESIGIADMTQFVLQSDNTAFVQLTGVKGGDKHLFLSDFAVYESGGSPTATNGAGYDGAGGRLDTFAHPQAGWLAFNAAKVARTGSGLQINYHQSDEHPLVLARMFPSVLLVKKTRLSLVLASAKPAKIMVQMESASGNKWKVLFDIAGQNTRKTWSFPFTDFAPDEENKSVDGKTEAFDPAHLHQITLLDLSGITDGASDNNVLTVSDLVVK